MANHEQLSPQGFQVTYDNPQYFYNFIRGQEQFITHPTPQQALEWLHAGSDVLDNVQFQNIALNETVSDTDLDGEVFDFEVTSLSQMYDTNDVLTLKIGSTIVRAESAIASHPFYTLEAVDQIVDHLNKAGAPSSSRFSGTRSQVVVNENDLGAMDVNFGSPGFINYSTVGSWFHFRSEGKRAMQTAERKLSKGESRIYTTANLSLDSEANFHSALVNAARNYQLLLTAIYEVQSKAPPPVTIHLKSPSALTTRLKLD